MTSHTDDTPQPDDADALARRAALNAFMERRKLKPHPWAKSAGVSSSALYNFLNGTSSSLSWEVLQKLAQAANSSVAELCGEAAADDVVKVEYLVGTYGRMYPNENRDEVVGMPPAVNSTEPLFATRITGAALHPLREGWLLYAEQRTTDPAKLIGKLAKVKPRGGAQLVIATIRRASTVGLYTLEGWNTPPLEDVDIEAAHLVVAITQPA